MGRWSQRTRCGGGLSLNWMLSAIIDDATHITVTFLTDAPAASFSNADFNTNSPIACIGIAQNTSNSLTLEFAANITGETELLYTGDAPSVLSPQTIALA